MTNKVSTTKVNLTTKRNILQYYTQVILQKCFAYACIHGSYRITVTYLCSYIRSYTLANCKTLSPNMQRTETILIIMLTLMY